MNETVKQSRRFVAISSFVLMISGFLLTVSSTQAQAAFKFVSWADTKSSTTQLSELSDQAVQLYPAFTIYEGDLEDSGFTSSGINNWKEAMDGQLTGDSTPNGMFDIVFAVRGNHDDSNTAGWQAYFDFQTTAYMVGATNFSHMPGEEDLTYSFDYENSHFIGVDVPGDVSQLTSAQISWIDADLTAAEERGLTHAFLYWHGPVYCVDGHCSCSGLTGCIEPEAEALIEVLNQHPILSATFHGHEHTYAHTYIDASRIPSVTRPFHQFITGAAGAGPSSCDGVRCDYNMAEDGFVTVDVDGPDVTVTFYQLGSMVAQNTISFTKEGWPLNQPPVANDDPDVYTPVNTDITINVAANDTDPDGNLDPASANTECGTCKNPDHGLLDNHFNGSFLYTPATDYQGSDSFIYEICDALQECDTANVNITVTPPNNPPAAGDDSAITDEDTPVTIDVAVNDLDGDGNLNPTTINTACTDCADPGNGSLVKNADDIFEYTPNPDYNGPDSFVYQICDTWGLCDTAQVTITVDPVADLPAAGDDGAVTIEGVAVTIDVAANDSDPDGNLNPDSAAVTGPPTYGQVVNSGNGLLEYMPNPGFSGIDSFVYEICDTDIQCDTATVSITVNPAIPDIFEVRISTGNDDAEERSSGSMSLTSSDLELVYDSGGNQHVGLRFNGVDIPPGATIVNAYVQFKADETHSGTTSLTIEGEATDDAPGFSSSTGNISSRARTAASVSWSPAPWTSTGAAGLDQRTPDIAEVIEEIVGRQQWASGNSLVIIISGSGERTAESYNGDSGGAPLLHVEYYSGLPN